MSVISDLSDAITTELNATVFSISFTAVRSYQPTFSSEDMGAGVRVDVVPVENNGNERTASIYAGEYVINIIVHRRITDTASIDACVDLCEEISNHFLSKRLDVAGIGEQVINVSDIDPVADGARLNEHKQFVSAVRLTIFASKSI